MIDLGIGNSQSENLARNMLSPRLLMIHNTGRGGENDVSELTRWKELHDPLLHVGETDVVPGGNAASLVDTSVKLDDDLASAVVIDLFELANVTCSQEVNVRICCLFS